MSSDLEWERAPEREVTSRMKPPRRPRPPAWRPPTLAELIGLFGELGADARDRPPSGATFWSASGSLAPANKVRAIRWEEGGRLIVLLIPKTDRAQRWGVRRRRAP
jgi:hypothetical protein